MGNGATVHDPEETRNFVDKVKETKYIKVLFILLLLIPPNITIKKMIAS